MQDSRRWQGCTAAGWDLGNNGFKWSGQRSRSINYLLVFLIDMGSQ